MSSVLLLLFSSTVFHFQSQDYTVSNDKVDELESERNQDDEDIAEGGGIDLPDSNR